MIVDIEITSGVLDTDSSSGGDVINVEMVIGEVGEKGADGKDGADGADGKDGADGADGKDGADGADGTDGITPHIGDNGNWYIGTTDTGVYAGGDYEVMNDNFNSII